MKIKLTNNYLELYLYLPTVMIFTIGLLFEYSWKIGWFYLSIILLVSIFYYLKKTIQKQIIYDKLLFTLGVFIFIIVEPFYFIIIDSGFPYVDNQIINNNYFANKAGVIISVYIFSFFIGRLIAIKLLSKKNKNTLSNSVEKINVKLLMIYIFLAITPFFVYGSSDLISNFFMNIMARSSGYVAFSSSGAGSQNPIITLLVQSIPTTILLMAIYVKKSKFFIKILAIFITVILMFLYISMGGRSGTILIFLTLGIIFFIKYKKIISIKKLIAIGGIIVFILTLQINLRDNVELSSNKISRTAFHGASLNRELAFIAKNYGETYDFISADTIIEKLLLPWIDTFVLFITNPIPRKFWESKPIDASFGAYNELRLGATGFGQGSNITPTVPGRYYMKYGIIGVIEIAIIVGFLWAWANIYIIKYQNRSFILLLIPVFSSVILFIATRDFAPGRYYPLLYLILFYYLNKLKVVR